MKNKIFIIPFIFFSLCALIYFNLTTPNLENKEKQEIPSFTLPLLNGDKEYVNDDIIKEEAPFLISFWATWCAPCIEEMPILKKLNTDYNIPILGVNYRDTQKNITSFFQKNKINPFSYSAYDLKGEITVLWGIKGIPTHFLVDKNGDIIYRYDGPLTQNDIPKILDLIQEK